VRAVVRKLSASADLGRAKTASGDPALTPFITLYAREGADGGSGLPVATG
jgi:hypothetical protein